jgi:hypothetical protein
MQGSPGQGAMSYQGPSPWPKIEPGAAALPLPDWPQSPEQRTPREGGGRAPAFWGGLHLSISFHLPWTETGTCPSLPTRAMMAILDGASFCV